MVGCAETAKGEPAQAADDGRGGFGDRIEKMLRMAEREAHELRAEARREAAEILEEARAQARARERELDETLAARQAEFDERAERVDRDLQAQKAMTDKLAAARQETEGIRARAEADAASVLEEARRQARTVLFAAENAARKHDDWVHGEIERLVGTRDGVRAELTRLREHLAGLPNDMDQAHVIEAATAPAAAPTADGTPSQENVRPCRPDDPPRSSAPPAGDATLGGAVGTGRSRRLRPGPGRTLWRRRSRLPVALDQRAPRSASPAASPRAPRSSSPQATTYIYGQISAQDGSTWTVQGMTGTTYTVTITPRTGFGTLFHKLPRERFEVGHSVRIAGDFASTSVTATAVSFTKPR